MENKKIIVIALMLILFSTSIYAAYTKKNTKTSDYVITIFEKHKANVDDGASALVEDDNFKKMSLENQIGKMEKLLKLYEKKGDIKNLYYDEKNKTFTFQYKDGVLGGMKMTKYNSILN